MRASVDVTLLHLQDVGVINVSLKNGSVGKIETLTAVASRLFGRTTEQTKGKDVTVLIPRPLDVSHHLFIECVCTATHHLFCTALTHAWCARAGSFWRQASRK